MLDTHFWGQLLEGSNVAELGDQQKKRLFLNNAVKSLIPFKENHEGLMWPHVPLEGSSNVVKKVGLSPKEGIFFEAEKVRMKRNLRTY